MPRKSTKNIVASELEQFFVTYNKLQGKQFTILGRGGVDDAQRLVEQALIESRKRKP